MGTLKVKIICRGAYKPTVKRASTIGQLVRMIEIEYTANLSVIPRDKYDENVAQKFKEFIELCDDALKNRKIAPSQADRVLSYKMLIEKELEWYNKHAPKH
ncbi:MAG: hypothetical protein QW514_04850 [Thermoprotei archaeon]